MEEHPGRPSEAARTASTYVDDGFWRLWEAYSGFLASRTVLDERSRSLAAIGQCATLGLQDALRSKIREAAAAGTCSAREIVEVTLQASVYVGFPRSLEALRVALDALDQVSPRDEQRPAGSADAGIGAGGLQAAPGVVRTTGELERLIEKYGPKGIMNGLRLTPTQHAWWLSFLDGIDETFTQAWLDFCFAGMYARGVIDDRTRTLIMVGNCVASADMDQARNHMRNAIILGWSVEEVREVLLQSTVYIGMPRALGALRALEECRQGVGG